MQDRHAIEIMKPANKNWPWHAALLILICACFTSIFVVALMQPQNNRWLDTVLFNDKSQSMLPYIEYFVTWDGKLDIESVAGDDSLPFTAPTDEKEICFGASSEYIWLRFMPSLFQEDMDTEDYVVFFDDAFFTDWEMYRPVLESGTIRYQSSMRETIITKNAIFPKETIHMVDVTDQYYYIQYRKENMAHRFLIDEYDQFLDTQIRLISMMLVSIGFLLGMIVMNLLMLYSTKERQYLFHTVFQGCSLLLLLLFSGMTLWISGKVYGLQVLQMQVITVLAAGLFFYHFQDLGHRHKRLGFVFRLLLIVGSIAAVIALLLQYDQLLLFAQAVSGVILLVMGVVAAGLFLSGYRVTVRFLTGFFLAIFAGFLSSLSVLGLIPISYVTYYFIFPAFAIESFLFTSSITSEIRKRDTINRTLRVELNTDALTGLRNRHYIENIVKPEMLALEGQQKPISMLMFDIDFFKHVNDTYGHDVGDQVLIALSQIAKDFFRSSDSLTRWGGEEFAIFMPSTTLKQAREAGERFRRRVETWTFTTVTSLTISLGAAQKAPTESFEQWFKRTDSAMYISKKTGRNRIEISYPLLDENNQPIEVRWDTACESKNPVIDADHIRLIKLVNRLLYRCFGEGITTLPLDDLNTLFALTAQHFLEEESILRTTNYPYLIEHALEHKRLLERAQSLLDGVITGSIGLTHLMQFVVGELIVGHMKQEDVLFFRYLQDFKQLP